MEGPRVQVIWKGKSLLVPIGEDDDVEKLRFVLCELTGVAPRNQKLFGWKAKTVDDTTLLTALGLGAETKKLSLVGNADADIVAFDADAAAAAAAQVADDEDVGLEEVAPESREENVRKLALRVQSSPVVELHPAREGMRLLVLDVDYTIFDHKSPVESVATQTRPWLHEFLATAYAQFDIVIWSATSMKWVELKCQQMGMLSHPDYRLRFLLDERPMFTIENVHRGRKRVHRVKPLEFIWQRFPMYGPHNTVMFDDCTHNFALNKQSGLAIKPFANCNVDREADVELQTLARYLEAIAAREKDFRVLDHRLWRRYDQ